MSIKSYPEQEPQIGSWEWEWEGDSLYWSDEVYRIYGLEPGECEATFDLAWDPIHPDDKDRVGMVVEAARKRGIPYSIKYRILRPDGAERTIHSICGVRKNDAGKVLRLFGTTHDVSAVLDITERKQAENRLKRSESMLREAQKVAHLGSWEWDLLSGQAAWSEEMCRIHGRKPEDGPPPLEGWMHYIHEQDREKLRQAIDDALYKKTDYKIDYRIKRFDNQQIRWLLAKGRVQRDESGKPLLMLGTVQDITERKQIEEALLESEEKYRTVVEQANEGILIMQDGERKYYNPRWVEISGYSAKEYLNIPNGTPLHPDDVAHVKARHAKILAGDAFEPSAEVRLIRRSGEILWLSAKTSRIHWEGRP